jgi:hypothetical protein
MDGRERLQDSDAASPFLCANFFWKIVAGLQGFASLNRYMGVERNTKAGAPKSRNAGRATRIYDRIPMGGMNMKRLTALLLTLALLMAALALPAQAASYATATVKGGWLRLREAPSTDAVAPKRSTSSIVSAASEVRRYATLPSGRAMVSSQR